MFQIIDSSKNVKPTSIFGFGRREAEYKFENGDAPQKKQMQKPSIKIQL